METPSREFVAVDHVENHDVGIHGSDRPVHEGQEAGHVVVVVIGDQDVVAGGLCQTVGSERMAVVVVPNVAGPKTDRPPAREFPLNSVEVVIGSVMKHLEAPVVDLLIEE